MKKQQPAREKTRGIQDQDLAWAKGSSGYIVASGREESDPDPTDPNGGG
jgi:hypothetical protein